VVCEAWQGDFDDNDNPLLNGLLFMPGTRTCGHRDCINVAHVEGALPPPERKRGRPAKPIDEDVLFMNELLKRRRNG
jgi:hypothetical protein